MLGRRWWLLLVVLVAVLGVVKAHIGGQTASAPPNIVLIQIDTLRQDHVGCYGYQRPTTPNLDRFARSGVTFRNAYSVTSWTLPAVTSLLTGLLPSRHGVRAIGDLLPPTIPSVARILHLNGYRTAAISANFAFVNPGDAFPEGAPHLGQGFETFQVLWQQADPTDREAETIMGKLIRTVRADGVTSKMADFLRTTPEPFFLFTLQIDPHYGYEPPEGYRFFEPVALNSTVSGYLQDGIQLRDPLSPDDLQHLVNLYDGEIRYADEMLGDFLASLDESGMADRTVVIILADHGEAFGEHGRMLHGQSLYDNTLRIPLMVRGPSIPAGVVVDGLVSITDIMPTVLELADLPPQSDLDGRSLASAWRHPHGQNDRTLLFELDNELELLNGPRLHSRAVREGDWKLIASLDGSRELYNIAQDPGEINNLAATKPEIVSHLSAALPGASELAPTPEARPTLGEAEKERLRALGYGTGSD